MPTIVVRVSEGMKAEIETLADEGAWEDQAHFIREALDIQIQKYWQGERFCQKEMREDCECFFCMNPACEVRYIEKVKTDEK